MPATAPRQTHRRQAHKLIADLPQTSGKSHLFCLCHLTDSCSHKSGDDDRSGELNPVQLLRFDADSASESATYLRFICDICSHMPEGIGNHLADTSQA